MCEILDKVEARGIGIGEARGISIGEKIASEKYQSEIERLKAELARYKAMELKQ